MKWSLFPFSHPFGLPIRQGFVERDGKVIAISDQIHLVNPVAHIVPNVIRDVLWFLSLFLSSVTTILTCDLDSEPHQ